MAMPNISLMQPHFCPSFSFFELMSRSDKFVLLRDVQLSRQSYQTRNRFTCNGEKIWKSVSIQRSGISTRLIDAQITPGNWKIKFIKFLKQNYAKSRYFDDLSILIEFFENWTSPSLSLMNEELILLVSKLLDLETEVIRDTELKLPSARKDRILNLLEQFPDHCYLFVGGGLAYMVEDGLFQEGHRYATFQYEPFEFESFECRSSVLEAVAFLGWEKLKNCVGEKSNVKKFAITEKF